VISVGCWFVESQTILVSRVLFGDKYVAEVAAENLSEREIKRLLKEHPHQLSGMAKQLMEDEQ